MAEMEIVGKHAKALRSDEILTGQARYCRDLYFPNMLVGKVLYSEYPHARIKRLDIGAAKDVPGAVAVLTHQDIPGENSYLYAEPDQPLLVSEIDRTSPFAMTTE